MKYLNELYVNRVKNNTPELTAASADEAFEQVRKERKRELIFTYNGFFDMRRLCIRTRRLLVPMLIQRVKHKSLLWNPVLLCMYGLFRRMRWKQVIWFKIQNDVPYE